MLTQNDDLGLQTFAFLTKSFQCCLQPKVQEHATAEAYASNELTWYREKQARTGRKLCTKYLI